MLNDIKENSEFDPGWDERGGIFIARSKVNSCFFSFYLSFKFAIEISEQE